MHRRKYLAAVGTLGAPVVAGCPGDGSDTSTPAGAADGTPVDEPTGSDSDHERHAVNQTTLPPESPVPTVTPAPGDAVYVQGTNLSKTSNNGAIVSGTLFNDHDYEIEGTITAVLYDANGERITNVSETYTVGSNAGTTFFLQYDGEGFEDAVDYDISVSV